MVLFDLVILQIRQVHVEHIAFLIEARLYSLRLNGFLDAWALTELLALQLLPYLERILLFALQDGFFGLEQAHGAITMGYLERFEWIPGKLQQLLHHVAGLDERAKLILLGFSVEPQLVFREEMLVEHLAQIFEALHAFELVGLRVRVRRVCRGNQSFFDALKRAV